MSEDDIAKMLVEEYRSIYYKEPDAKCWNGDQLLDLAVLDAGEFFTYVEHLQRDDFFGWPNIGHWYTYRAQHLHEAQNQTSV